MSYNKLKVGPYNIIGYSRSAKKTGFFIPSLNIVLDAGIQFDGEINLILITHGHTDHINQIYPLIKDNNKHPTIITPNRLALYTQRLLDAFRSITRARNCNVSHINVCGMNQDSVYTYKRKGREVWKIHCYQMDHGVPCLSYGIHFTSKKLKDKYQQEIVKFESDKKQIGNYIKSLKQQGLEINQEIELPYLFFGGDTSKESLPEIPFELYPHVMIECTFFEEEDYQLSIQKKHLHWRDLLDYVKIFKTTQFILIHFSAKYKMNQLKEYEQQIHSDGFDNVTFFY